MKKRGLKSVFIADATQHIYQRSIDHGIIFYTLEDRLVYYTLSAVNARRHKVVVTSAAIMFSHIHQGVRATSLKVIEDYLHDTNTSFARLYNYRYQRKGRLFQKPPGRAQKASDKSKRSVQLYIYNNHVEKKLCQRAVDERWSLLVYAGSDHPFSLPLDFKKASKPLQKALRLVDRRCRKMEGLEYADLDKIFPVLDNIEREQFVDYVISRYAWIDYKNSMALFGNYEQMVIAADSTTGSEYDINEDYNRESDRPYQELIAFSKAKGVLNRIYSLNADRKSELMFEAMRCTSASPHHLKSFFHADIKIVK